MVSQDQNFLQGKLQLFILLPEVPLPVELLPAQPPDHYQLLSPEATRGEGTLVASIRVGSSSRQTLF